jgi:hypothetical protein
MSSPKNLTISTRQRVLWALLATLVSFYHLPPSQAQNPPAKTYQPGFWQPVARFNPEQPVNLTLINQSGVTLNFDITSAENLSPRDLPLGESVTLSNLGNVNYIMIYPVNTDPAINSGDRPLTLKFEVQVEEKTNAAQVTITQAEPSFLGHRTINLQKTGAIFFY